VISTFARYRRNFNSNSRLLLVGRDEELELYREELCAHAKRLQVEDGVVFTGHITIAELVAYYRVADVLLCLSEHEGFAVPLVEAMHFGVPVVALARAAVPETLRGAGILIEDLDFDLIAATIDRVCADREYRRCVLAAQRRRLRDFAPAKVAG